MVSSAALDGYTPANCANPSAVDGGTYHYFAYNPSDPSEHEEGDGVYTVSTTTLTRANIRNSSNSGSAVDFTNAPIVVMGGPAAQDMDGWEYIGSADPSGASSVDFTDLSAFQLLRLTGYCTPSADATDLLLRTDANNGASFDAGASDYEYAHSYVGTNGGNGVGNSTGDTSINMALADNDGPTFIDILLIAFNKAMNCAAKYSNFSNSATTIGENFEIHGSGQRLSTTARDAIRFLPSTGTITGHFDLWGKRG